MFRFLRRNKQDSVVETQNLQESFVLSKVNSDGFPRKVHKFAIDVKERLLAVATETGNVEVFNGLERRILLKKLGKKPCFFEFLESKRALLLVCSETPGTSHLPEAIHLLDVDGQHPCFTHNRPRSNLQSTAHCLYEECLLSCAGTSISKIHWDQLWPSAMSTEPFINLNLFMNGYDRTIRAINVYQHTLIALLDKDLAVIVNAKSRALLKSISFKINVESFIINPVDLHCYFASSQFVCTLNLEDLTVAWNGRCCPGFESLIYYNKVKVRNRHLTVYCNGFPSEYSRDTCVMINDGAKNKVFSFSDVVLDMQMIYGDNDLSNRLAILLEHEFVILDMDSLDFNRLSLPYLNCVDFSTVSTVKLIPSLQPPFDGSHNMFCNLFGPATPCTTTEGHFFCTGHQNGNVLIWKMTRERLDMLTMIRPSDVLTIGEAFNDVESMDSIICGDFPSDIIVSEDPEKSDIVCIDESIRSPTQIFKPDDAALKIGLYDDRCDDDGCTVEVISVSKAFISVGLNAGIVLCYPLNGKGLQSGETANIINVNLGTQGANEKQGNIRPVPLTSLTMPPFKNILSIIPQTPIRSLSISEKLGVVAVGCSTGIVIYNPLKESVIFKRNFLSTEDTRLVLSEEKPLTRLKSMKQSVRRTFRKKDPSTRQKPIADREVAIRDVNSPWTHGFRSLKFFESSSEQTLLYAGTGNGILFLFGVKEDACTLFKEVRLAHRAPVCSLSFLNVDPLQPKLIVFTEEQIRSFNAESLKSSNLSYKITAKCGIKIRRGVVVKHNGFSYLNIICNDATSLALSVKEKNARISKRFGDMSDNSAIRLSDVNENSMVTVSNSGTIITLFKLFLT